MIKTIIDSLTNNSNLSGASIRPLENSTNLLPIQWGTSSVQAAIIISMTTILTVILGFMFKEYWIPGWIDKRTRKRTGQELFKRHKNNIFHSSNSLMHRLAEVYRTRSHFLWEDTPQSNFYDYKYKSSVYRLCVLLGQIRAYKLDEPFITIDHSDREKLRITDAISALQKSLADGQNIEMFIVRKIITLTKIDQRKIDDIKQAKLSIAIDHLLQKHLTDSNVDLVANMSSSKKNEFVEDIKQLVLTYGADSSAVDSNKEEIIRIVSIRVSLIYRDWQQAIGDMMLENRNEKDTTYQVIGYGKFEEIFMNKANNDNKWIKRSETIFKNLDVNTTEAIDSRINQIERIYSCLYNLIKELHEINVGGRPMKSDDFKNIPKSIAKPVFE